MKFKALILSAVLLVCSISFAQVVIKPTTTLAAETERNSSASPTYNDPSVGNDAGNVSAGNIHDLVLPGYTGKVMAHYMAWWGSSSHLNIGMNEDDPATVDKQVAFAKSRGFDGFVIDYYGTSHSQQETTVQNVFHSAASQGNFKVALCVDAGALPSNTTDPTAALLAVMSHIAATYVPQASYLRDNTGRPVVLNFGLEKFKIDWTKVKAAYPDYAFVWRDTWGFTAGDSAGSFPWIAMSATGDVSYFTNFYNVASTHPTALAFGGAQKGFNDAKAAWTQHRYAAQNCGMTWLNSFTKADTYLLNKPSALFAFQMATWNDYEEGTEIETGIDNCATMTASVSGTLLNYSPVFSATSGSEATVDHYTVFVSTDGQNLMPLQNLATSAHSLNLANFNLAPGTYTLYVKAQGKPMILNHMSNAVTYTVDPPPVVQNKVTIYWPNNSTYIGASGFGIKASATATSGPVKVMQVYIDGKKVYEVLNVAQFQTVLKTTVGPHKITVQAYDVNYKYFYSYVTVTAR